MQRPPHQSAYNDCVFEIVRAIPPGKVMTYGGVAALIPPPSGVNPTSYARVRARWVGYAMAVCPEGVPWHRVINAQGRVSKRRGFGPQIQRVLLEQEGVVFDERDRVDLKHYVWRPPTDWLLARDFLPPSLE